MNRPVRIVKGDVAILPNHYNHWILVNRHHAATLPCVGHGP
jgi:hypothetical protein